MADQTIVHQTTAKVAAELVASTQPRTIEDALAAYDRAFAHVLNSINFAGNTKDIKKTKGRQTNTSHQPRGNPNEIESEASW